MLKKIGSGILGLILLIPMLACQEKDIAVKTADAYTGINVTLQISKDLNISGQLSKDTYLGILNLAEVVTTDLDHFKETAKALGTITAQNKAVLIAQISDTVSTVGKIGASGLGIKNAQSIQKFNDAVAIIQIALQTLQTVLVNLKKPIVVSASFTTSMNNANNDLKNVIADSRKELSYAY